MGRPLDGPTVPPGQDVRMHTPKVLIDRISVSDGLYLSDLRSVVSREGRAKIKEEFKIRRILTVMEKPVDRKLMVSGCHYLHLPAHDGTEDLLGSGVLQRALDFIEKAVSNRIACLVHCQFGVSRSVTIVAAYLMKRNRWNCREAIDFIQERRSDKLRRSAPPNPSFRRQLEVFESLDYRCHPHQISNSPVYRQLRAELQKNRNGREDKGRRKQIVCFGCGEEGHSFRLCPNPMVHAKK